MEERDFNELSPEGESFLNESEEESLEEERIEESLNRETPVETAQQVDTIVNPERERLELNALARHLDLYLFTHTPFEEMQPPDKEELKKLNEIEKLPVAPPIPLRVRPYRNFSYSLK